MDYVTREDWMYRLLVALALIGLATSTLIISILIYWSIRLAVWGLLPWQVL